MLVLKARKPSSTGFQILMAFEFVNGLNGLKTNCKQAQLGLVRL